MLGLGLLLCLLLRYRQQQRRLRENARSLIEGAEGGTHAHSLSVQQPSRISNSTARSSKYTVPAPTTLDHEDAEQVKVLGRGSHGVVYLLRTKSSKKLIVCKRMAIDGLNEADVFSLENEVRLMESLSHRNIIKYQDYERLDNYLCIYMEYAEGGSLDKLISDSKKAKEPFAVERIFRWIEELTSGVQHLHAGHVLHRDLKSANVLLSADDTIKLGDFGVSRSLSTYTHFASTTVGTPHCMAPEVLSSQLYQYPADVWALGVLIFELLTLQRPFHEPHLATLVAKITKGEINDAAIENCKHPSELKDLVGRNPESRRLLHPDPDERMQLVELEEYLADIKEMCLDSIAMPSANECVASAKSDV